jgi:inosine-uridine nucleoside N-ribohydrolase
MWTWSCLMGLLLGLVAIVNAVVDCWDTSIADNIPSIVFFCDADKDDLYTLAVLYQLHQSRNLQIKAIVLDDGFLSIDEGFKMVDFWMNEVLKTPICIPLIKGTKNTNNTRQYPVQWVESYMEEMKTEFQYDPSSYMPKSSSDLVDQTLDERLHVLLANDQATAIVTRPATSVAAYHYLASDFARVHLMSGNVTVPGNTVENDGQGEFNLWMDPSSVSDLFETFHGPISICPLDCTNWTPLTADTVSFLDKQMEYSESVYARAFLRMIKTTLSTVNGSYYCWDLTACMALLFPNLTNAESTSQRLLVHNHGNYYVSSTSGRCVKVFTYIDLRAMLSTVANVFLSE